MDMDIEALIQSRHELTEIGGRDIFEKAYKFDIALHLRAIGLYPYFRAIEFNEGPEGVLNGKRVIMLGSNNLFRTYNRPESKRSCKKSNL